MFVFKLINLSNLIYLKMLDGQTSRVYFSRHFEAL